MTPLARSRRLTVMTDPPDAPVEPCPHAGPYWAGAGWLVAGLRFGTAIQLSNMLG